MSFYKYQDTVNNNGNNHVTIPRTSGSISDTFQRVHDHSVIVRNPGLVNMNHLNSNVNDIGQGTKCRDIKYVIKDNERGWKNCQEKQEGSLSVHPVQIVSQHIDGSINVLESSENLPSPNLTQIVHDNSDYLNRNVLKPNSQRTDLSVEEAQKQSHCCYGNVQLSEKPFTEFTRVTKPCKIGPHRSRSDSFVHLHNRDDRDNFDHCSFLPVKSFQNNGNEQSQYNQFNLNATGMFTESNNNLSFGAAGDTDKNQDCYGTRYSSPMSVSSQVLHSWLDGSDSNDGSRLVICESESDDSVDNLQDENNAYLENKNRHGYLGKEETEDKDTTESDLLNEKNIGYSNESAEKLNCVPENKSENCMNNSIYLDAICDEEDVCQENSMYVSCLDDNEEDSDGNYTDTTQIYVDFDFKDQPHPLKLKVDKLKDDIKNYKLQCATPSRKSSSNFKIEPQDFKNSTFKLFFKECIDGLLNDDEGIYDLASGKKLFELKDWIEKLITCNSSDKNIQIVDLIHLLSSCVVLAHTALKNLSFLHFPSTVLVKDGHDSSSHFEALLKNRLQIFVTDGLMMSDLAFNLYEQVQKEELDKKITCDNKLSEKKDINADTPKAISKDMNPDILASGTLSDPKVLSSESSSKNVSDIDSKEISFQEISEPEVLSFTNVSAVSSTETISDIKDCKVPSNEKITSDFKVFSSETVSDTIDSKMPLFETMSGTVDLKMPSSETMPGTIESKVLYSATLANAIDSKSQTNPDTIYFNVIYPQTVSNIIDSNVHLLETTDNSFESKVICSDAVPSNMHFPETKLDNVDSKVSFTKSISDIVYIKVLPSETITGAIDSNELSSVVLPDKIESNVCFEDTTPKVMDPIVSSSETLSDRIDSTVVSYNATTDATIFNVTSTGTLLDPGIIKSNEPVTEAVEMLQAVKETEDLYNMAKTTSQIRSAYQPTVTKPVRRKLKLINEYRYSPAPCLDEAIVNTADDEYGKSLIQHVASNAGGSRQVPDNILKSFNPVNQDHNMLEENKVPLNNYGLLVMPINGGSMKEINGSLITENISPICDTEIKSEADLEVSRRSSQNCQQHLKDSKDRGHTTNKNRERVSQQADCSSLQNRNDPAVKQNRKHETGMTVKYSDDVVLKRKRSEDVSPTRVCNELNINETKNTSEVQKHIQHSGQESAKECQSLQKDSVKSIQELPRKCVEEKYDQGKSETKNNDTPPTSPFKSLSDPEKARAMFKNLKLICSPVLTSLVNSRGDKSTQVSEKVINCYHTQNKIDSRAADSNGKNQNRKDMCRENICKEKQRQSENMCKETQRQSENMCKETQRQSENMCKETQRQSENMCKQTQRQSEHMCKETQRQSKNMCKETQRQSENLCKETQRQSENMCKDKQRHSENMCKDKQRHSENKRSNVCDDDRVKKTSQFKNHTKENHTKNRVSSQTNNGQNANAEILFTPDKNTSKIKTCKNVSHGEKRKGLHGHEKHVAHIENGSPCKIRKTSSHVKEAADNVSFQSSPCKIRKFEGTSMHQNVNKTSKYHNTCGSSANDRHVNSFTTNIPDRDSTKKSSTSKHSRPVLSSEKSDNKTKIKIKQANRISEVYDQSSVTNSKGQNSIKEKQPTTTNDSCHNKDYRITKEETSTTGHSHRDDSVSREIPSKRQTGQNGIKVVATTETSSRKQSHRKDDQKVTTETTIKGHSHRKDDKIVTIEGSSKGHSHRKNSQNVSANASKHTRPNDHGQRFTPNKSINDQIHKKDLQLEIASKTQKSDKDMRKNISSQSCSNQNDGQNVSTKPSSHRKDYHNSSEDTTLERKVYRSEKKSRERKSDHDKVKHLERTFEIVTSTNSGRSVALQVSINESSASFSNVSVSGVVDSSRHSCNTSTVQYHTGVKSKSSDSGKTTSSGQTNDKRHIGNNCKNTEHSNVKTCNNNRLYSSNKDGCHGNRIRKSSSERSSKRKHKTFESSDRGTVSRKTAVKDYSNKRNELQHTTYTIADDGIETNFDQSVIGFTLKTERQLAVHVSSSKSKLTPGSSRYVADYRDKDEDIQNGKLENKENHRNGRNSEHTQNSSYGMKESGHTKRLEKDLNVSTEPSIKVRSSSSVLEEVPCDNYTVETSSSSEALNIVSKQRNDISFSSISDSSSEDEEQIKPFYGSGFSLLHSLSHTLLDEEADLPSLILPNKRRNMKNHHGNLRRCHRSDLNSQNNIQKILAREYSQQSDDIVSPSDVASSSNTSEISNLINRSPDRESVSPLSRRHRHRRKYLLDYACTSSSSEEIIPECRQRGLQSKKECFMILDRIYNYRLAEPFRHEVRSQDVPGYYLVIKRGMCLDMMAHKLRDNIYEKVEDFVTDMRLIFNNCRLFHQRGSPIYEAGQAVERYFDKMMKEVFPDPNRYEFL